MMHSHDFEAELQRRPQRQLPPEWRREILHAAATAHAEATRGLAASFDVAEQDPLSPQCHPERSAGGKAGEVQPKDPVGLANGSSHEGSTTSAPAAAFLQIFRPAPGHDFESGAPLPTNKWEDKRASTPPQDRQWKITPAMWRWGSLAAVWMLIGLLNLSAPVTESQTVQATAPAPDWEKQWNEQRRMLADLLQQPDVAPAEPPRREIPFPRPRSGARPSKLPVNRLV
ncbi:MAG TPA: hypothetical protein VF614_06500 [Chthoniobacteraceae bacterium]|jgi:hypothetical protein